MNDASNTGRPLGSDPGAGHGFDLLARRHYEQSLEAIPPLTLARLRAARREAATPTSPPRGLGWMLAGACATVFAVAIALQLQLGPTPGPGPGQTAATNAVIDAADLGPDEADSVIAALDENPDLYLWLASNDDALPPPAGQWP